MDVSYINTENPDDIHIQHMAGPKMKAHIDLCEIEYSLGDEACLLIWHLM